MKIIQDSMINPPRVVNHYLLMILLFLPAFIYSQDRKPTWEELTEQYEFPEWYTEAKFGIWVHWGAQTQPRKGGGWYARNMYLKGITGGGRNAYPYHIKTYGHPSEIGNKDVINEWKAENLDTDALMEYFKGLGARYFVALANHHDHFDNFNSTYHPWNSVNVGPGRDIIGEFAASAKKYGLPFGVSSHDDRWLNWFLPAFGADTEGPYKGIPYDGHMTKEDGRGKWWEGLDPADLYGLPPEKRTPEWIKEVKFNWMLRHKELLTKYDVNMVWFDGYGFPYNEYGKEVCRDFFLHSLNKTGKINVVIAAKIKNESSIVIDIERGVAKGILLHPWQSITTMQSWFYKEDRELRQNSRSIIELFTDIISKNGNLLINVELLPDGTIPTEHKKIFDELGYWIHLNAEAVFASKPWKIYGDNLDPNLGPVEMEAVEKADQKVLTKEAELEQINERTMHSPPYRPEEVRFTTKDDILYIFVLNPVGGVIELPSLGMKSKYHTKQIHSIKMLGINERIYFRQDADKLILKIPEKRPNNYTAVFKVEGAL